MTTQDCIIALFYAVDQEMLDVPKHSEGKLYPSEVVPLAFCDDEPARCLIAGAPSYPRTSRKIAPDKQEGEGVC